jgi:hypothetical protein
MFQPVQGLAGLQRVELVFDMRRARDYNVDRLPAMTRREERNSPDV